MKDQRKRKGKDTSPQETIARIKKLLSDSGICSVSNMEEPEIPQCYTARIGACGVENYMGTNGKGTTKEFCLASGYAEFMERAQNRLFLTGSIIDDILKAIRQVPGYERAYRIVGEEEIWNRPESYIHYVVNEITKSIKRTVPGIGAELTVRLQLREAWPALEKRQVLLQPFYHVGKKTYEWQPAELLQTFFMSNGMAAGNTYEEALVQGYAEIFERYSQIKIMTDRITPPDLPPEVWGKYPYVVQTVEAIQSSGPYRVILKDCSLGEEGLPVVCGIIINTETLSFGIRFGAHPDMEIALERVFTESLQGKTLEQFSKFSSVVFDEGLENNFHNLFNNMKTGSGYYPASFFSYAPSYEYRTWEWDKNSDNAALAKQMTEWILRHGKEILVHDASFLGFPTVWIVIPGMSELLPYDTLYLKELGLRSECAQIMHRADRVTDEEVQRLILYCRWNRDATIENTINHLYHIPFAREFHGGLDQLGFLEAVCHYRLGELDLAIRLLGNCLKNAPEPGERIYLTGVIRYLMGKKSEMPQEELWTILKLLGGEELAERIQQEFEQPAEALRKLYPVCGYPACEDCTHSDCQYNKVEAVYHKLYQAYSRSDACTARLQHVMGEMS